MKHTPFSFAFFFIFP
ncbi:pheA operon leader peptide PheL [Escherichia coli]|nr:pheA operon leader peptide PheL [Escherichia coli]QWU30617.1 pheA operon leader peptide PheL [Escherichia coli]